MSIKILFSSQNNPVNYSTVTPFKSNIISLLDIYTQLHYYLIAIKKAIRFWRLVINNLYNNNDNTVYIDHFNLNLHCMLDITDQ